MIQYVGDEYFTEELQEMLNTKDSIVKKIVLTCESCPEQYECFDEYGNEVAYLRLRYGNYTASCPDHSYNAFHVYGCSTRGHGNFSDDKERIEELSKSIDAIDKHYKKFIQCVDKIDVGDDSHYQLRVNDVNIGDAFFRLYHYQQTGMLPWQIQEIRKKGPVMGFEDCCMVIIKDHRLRRHDHFPEANGADGLSDEHIEQEIKYLLEEDKEYYIQIRTICQLFNKTINDGSFVEIFRKKSKEGWNAL